MTRITQTASTAQLLPFPSESSVPSFVLVLVLIISFPIASTVFGWNGRPSAIDRNPALQSRVVAKIEGRARAEKIEGRAKIAKIQRYAYADKIGLRALRPKSQNQVCGAKIETRLSVAKIEKRALAEKIQASVKIEGRRDAGKIEV